MHNKSSIELIPFCINKVQELEYFSHRNLSNGGHEWMSAMDKPSLSNYFDIVMEKFTSGD